MNALHSIRVPFATLFGTAVWVCITWALPIFADEGAWQSIESKAWKPIASQSARVSLLATDANGQETAISGRWSLLAPGDTLHFAVRGVGELQLQSRALFEGGANSRSYRLGVGLGPGDVRKLVRRSSFASMVRWNDTMKPQRMAELDRWKTELVAGAQDISLTLREAKSAPVLVRVLVRGRIEVPLLEKDLESSRTWRLRGSLQALAIGYDSNAYYTPKDATDTTALSDAWYWPLTVGASMEWKDALPFAMEIAYEFSTLQYEDAILDQTHHDLLLRESWDRLRMGELRLEQRLRAQDETFFGRGSDEEFETGSNVNPGSNVSLADRFDWREYALAMELSTRPATAWEFDVAAEWAHRDYVEDYNAEPDVYSLDQDNYGAELSLRRSFASAWMANLQAGVFRQDYDEKFARDSDGTEQPSVNTQLRRWPLEFGLRRQLANRSWAQVAVDGLITQDLREGYWDRSSIGVTGEGKWKIGGAWECGLRVHRSVTDYERSTVGNDVGAPIREKDDWHTRVDGSYVLRKHWQLFAGWTYANLENNSRKFAYDRSEVEAGVRAEF